MGADRPIREHYVVGADPSTTEVLAPDELRTEICWPIKPDLTDPATSTESNPS